MLSFQDCIDLSCLSEDEIDAIAEHEHIPAIVAMEYGNYLMQSSDGRFWIKRMIADDIATADAEGRLAHALALKLVLRRFLQEHPEQGEVAN